ncbi:MAG: hypothetical protein WD715_09215 [Dongiaceae bacterium]
MLLSLSSGVVAPAGARTLYVLPGDDPRLFVFVPHPAWRALNDELADFGIEVDADTRFITLSHALKMAGPGDEILLLPGLYDQNRASDVIRFARDGEPDAPIVLRAVDAGVDIRAAELPQAPPRYLVDESDGGRSLLEVPRFDEGSFCVQIRNRRGIVLDGLSGSNCDSALIGIRNSSYITIRNLDIRDLNIVVYAEGRDTHHLLIEDNVWTQDPDNRMWTTNHWCEYKDRQSGRLLKENGAFLLADNIAGSVVIRRNVIRQAFNAIHMWGGAANVAGRNNANVEIYDNRFEFIRDNVVEPEMDFTNWWVRDNRIRNAHAWFSLDGRSGRDFYLFNNVGWFDDKPGRLCDDRCRAWLEGRIPSSETCMGTLHAGGSVFKLEGAPNVHAPGPLYAFNNSWYLRAPLIKRGRLDEIRHWNNAIEFCSPGGHAADICPPDVKYFDGFALAPGSEDGRNLIDWDDEAFSFAFDLSNHPKFPAGLNAAGYRVGGLSVPFGRGLFRDPAAGDLVLQDDSAGIGSGCAIIFEAGKITCGPPRVDARLPDIGFDAGLNREIHFLYASVGNESEQPRVVHVAWPKKIPPGDGDAVVTIVFSTAIRLAARPVAIAVTLQSGMPPVSSTACRIEDARYLVCGFPAGTGWQVDAPAALLLPADRIVNVAGEAVTGWAAEPGYVRVQSMPPE